MILFIMPILPMPYLQPELPIDRCTVQATSPQGMVMEIAVY
jgi:hypothetical protein